MRRTDALKRTLEGLSRVYEGDKSVPVQFGSPSRAVPEGHDLPEGYATEDSVVISPNVSDELGRNLEGPQQLRCIANTLSHEIEHLRESDLTSKEAFMEQYDDHPQFAGMVINVLEDQYIDYTRTQRYPGLRKAQAFVVDSLMQNHHRWPRVDNIDSRPKAMQEAFRQLAFAGYAKGFEDADDWLREYLGRVRPLIDRVRREHDQEARKDIAHQCMAISEEYLPDNEDIELPDECAVCGENEPVVVVPLLGPVCEECAPSGHGPDDGRRDVEIPDDLDTGDGDGVPVPAPDDFDPDDLEGWYTHEFGDVVRQWICSNVESVIARLAPHCEDTRGDLPPLHPVDDLWVAPTDSEPTQASLPVAATDGGTNANHDH